MKKKLSSGIIILLVLLFINSCSEEKTGTVSRPLFEIQMIDAYPEFNAENAYRYIEKQISFGPRNPGSDGHKNALNYLGNEMKSFADDVIFQNFNYTGYHGELLNLTNIIGRFNPLVKDRIIIFAHWDTRPRADREESEQKQNQPIIGANDGGSGVAVILELARILKENNISYGIDLALFDGEDYGLESDYSNFCLGSKYFAVNQPSGTRYAFGVLLDMVGDKDAVFQMEGHSLQYARDIVDMIWDLAITSGYTLFVKREGAAIYDDHIPLNQAGIRSVNIIDSELVGGRAEDPRRRYWHTHSDNLENISRETLNEVGEVMVKLIYSLKFNADDKKL